MDLVKTVIHAVASRSGVALIRWPRLAAFVAGAVMTLALPPAGFFPVLAICAPVFIHLSIQAETRRAQFLTGWAFGAGYFIAGFYWISAALFVDIETWWWVLPLSLVLGPAVFAVYYGFIPLLAAFFKNSQTAYTLAFVGIWSLVDYARGHWLTGFPWNLPGYSWSRILAVEQTAAVGGVYFLSFLTLLWAALPCLWDNKKTRCFIIASFVIALLFGGYRLYALPTTYTETQVRIVQPNIPQTMKWDKDEEWRNFEKLLRLSRSPADISPAAIVWPETAVNADLDIHQDIARYIARNLPAAGAVITGNLRVTGNTTEDYKFYNSVTLLDAQAQVRAVYNKHHLVPFGEYIPYRDKIGIAPIAAAVSGIGDFTAGDGAQTIDIPVTSLPPFSPLICYEVIFPRRTVDPARRPAWIVNATNDAWYGHTSGPYQHLHITRMRAIEEGLPLARAANTGISTMIDPSGRLLATLRLGQDGYIDHPLPRALPPTLYSLYGDSVYALAVALLLLLAARLVSAEKKRPAA